MTEQDFVLGSIDQLHRLGVHSSAYQEAVDTMGDLTTAICLLIIDANMTRNSNPVRNPGGMLRAMTRQHKAGRLNLVGSLIGLDQKQKRKELRLPPPVAGASPVAPGGCGGEVAPRDRHRTHNQPRAKTEDM